MSLFQLIRLLQGATSVILSVVDIVIAALLSSILADIGLPWFAIAAKWVIIGRYKETGAAPLPAFGSMYLRWWLARQALKVAGHGFFAWHESLLVTYYRMLGAKIGRDVYIDRKVCKPFNRLTRFQTYLSI